MIMQYRVSVVGASGYTGVELIKMLINHSHFEITHIFSSEGSEQISALYPALSQVFDEVLQKTDIETIINSSDLVFLALPHKSAMQVAKPLLEAGVKVVDLSADYRLTLENYEAFYTKHLDPLHLQEAVYGLPEINREKIAKASLVAHPGCYPTAALLSIIPFLPYLDFEFPLMIDAKSGVSGAGKKCSSKTHFVSINENVFAYNPIKHRHSVEIKEKLESLAKELVDLVFVPHLLPLTRGMLVDSYVLLKEPIEPLEVLQDFYANEPFVRIKSEPVDVKSVAGTHFCDIFAKREGKKLFISSAIDNLLRGASSQAVANANIMMGLDEAISLPTIAYIP